MKSSRARPLLLSLPITGYAVCSALGATTTLHRNALRAARSALVAPGFALPFETRVGAVDPDLDALPPALAMYDSRAARIAMRLADELCAPIEAAVRRWGHDRVGLVVGTSSGGLLETEAALAAQSRDGAFPADYDLHRGHAFGAVVELLARRFGLRGPGYTVSTACSSGAKTFASARRLLAANVVDAVIVGGVETLSQTTLRGFHSLGILSASGCRPFAPDRDGTSLGEGGALFVIERDGEARARLLGEGESVDAFQMSAPHPEGLGARAAMEQALRRAGLDASAVGFVLAHGTGTALNDTIECAAIERVLGREVPVASTKAMTGHALGAAGALGAAFALLTLEESWLPASLGAGEVDPAITVNVLRAGRAGRAGVVLANAFGFGGSNVSLAFGAP